MSSFVIHDNICKLIHKKCRPKSYHNNKYHMTLNIIFSIVVDSKKLLQSTVTGLFSVILYGSHFPNSHLQAPSPSEWPMILIFPKSRNESLFKLPLQLLEWLKGSLLNGERESSYQCPGRIWVTIRQNPSVPKFDPLHVVIFWNLFIYFEVYSIYSSKLIGCFSNPPS
jgi:hypothetical protein